MKLSAREQQIIDLAREGYMNVNIAAILGLSQNTVRAHLKRIYSKLNLRGPAKSLSARRNRITAANMVNLPAR